MGCKYRVMDKCRAKDNIKDAFCFGKDGCPYYEDEVEAIPKADYEKRLKADMVAILEDLLMEIKYTVTMEEDASLNEDLVKRNNVIKVVQFRIDKLKEQEK